MPEVWLDEAPLLPADRDEQARRLPLPLECDGIYNLYSGTLFEKKHLRPSQVVLLLRGVAKGESSMRLAEELGVSRTTVHELRKRATAKRPKASTGGASLTDEHAQTDEMF